MCRFIIFYGKMSWCLIWALEWKCYFHPSAIIGFLSPPLLLLFYFLTERQGGTPLPAQLGHWGSSPKPWGERPRAAGESCTAPLHLGLILGLINGRIAAINFWRRWVPSLPQATVCPFQNIMGATCVSDGSPAIPRTYVCPCEVWAWGL